MVELKKILEYGIPIIFIGGLAIFMLSRLKPPTPPLKAEIVSLEVKKA